MKRSTSAARAWGSPASRRAKSARSSRARCVTGAAPKLRATFPGPSVELMTVVHAVGLLGVNDMSHGSVGRLMRWPDVPSGYARSAAHPSTQPLAVALPRRGRRYTLLARGFVTTIFQRSVKPLSALAEPAGSLARHRCRLCHVPAEGLQLLLPEGLPASSVADKLAGEVPIVSTRAHTIERTFWDTFDGRVHGAGLALVEAGRRLTLTDASTSAELASDALARGAARLLAEDLPAGALRERLEPLIEMRALTPVARVRSRQLPLNVLDERGKIVVRLRVEEPTALGGDEKAAVALRPRLHVVGVLGYDRELREVSALLSNGLGLVDVARPVQDDAVEAAGGAVGGVSSKLKLALEPSARADEAAVVILRRLLEVIDANLPGTLADIDSEFLHDLRVAVRRTRSLQRELRGVFAPEPLRVFRDGFKHLQAITGPTRDLDVQLLEFGELAAGLPAEVAGDVAPLRRLLEEHLVAERGAMVRELRSSSTLGLLDNWRSTSRGSSSRPRRTARCGAPVGEVAGGASRRSTARW